MMTSTRTIRGFSLVEVLVTVAVLAIALLALARFQGNLLQESGHAKTRTEAMNVAQDRIEELRTFANQAAFSALTAGSDTVSGVSETFTRTWTITPDAAQPNVLLAQVTVTWPNRDGQVTTDTTVTLSSAISNALPQGTGSITVATTAENGPTTTTTTTTTTSTVPPETDTTTTTTTTSTSTPSTPTTTTSTTVTTVPVPGSCNCFYKNDSQGVTSVSGSGSCCSISFCNSHVPPGTPNNSGFSVNCPP